jgi:predicted double-glycine peptidase
MSAWRACAVLMLLLGQVVAVRAVAAASPGNLSTVSLNDQNSVNVPLHSIKQLKLQRAFRTTWHQQYDFSCGSAALATLLTYHYNRPTDETTIFKAMFAAGDQAQIQVKGFSLLDMKRYLVANGYLADGVTAPLDKLVQVHVPAIALISDHGYRHFVVVKGVEGQRVLLGDPALGTRVLDRRDFERARVSNLFFVIRNHRETARFNARADWDTTLAAPISLAIDRESLAMEILLIPNATRF